MPGSFLGEILGEFFLRIVLEGICYFTGRVVVRLFTFRKLHVYIDKEEIEALQRLDPDNRKSKRTRRKMQRVKMQPPSGNELSLTSDTVVLIGVVTWVVIGISVFVLVVYVI